MKAVYSFLGNGNCFGSLGAIVVDDTRVLVLCDQGRRVPFAPESRGPERAML